MDTSSDRSYAGSVSSLTHGAVNPQKSMIGTKTPIGSDEISLAPLSTAAPNSKKKKLGHVVYIPDLPVTFDGDAPEDQIRRRLEKIHHVTVMDVKCYLSLGVATVRLSTNDEKIRLISEDLSMILDPKRNIIVSFVAQLPLESYIVLDRNKFMNVSSDEVSSTYAREYHTRDRVTCKSVSKYFPNIFQIVPNSLEDLIAAAERRNFPVGNVLATVYPLADCSFIEGLPSKMTDAQLEAAIVDRIGRATCTCVQINQSKATAIVLAARSAKNWLTANSIDLDGQNIPKRTSITYRVTLFPVARDSDVDAILAHGLFRDHVLEYEHNQDRLVIQLDGECAYEECLTVPQLCIHGKRIQLVDCLAFTNPGADEINAETWYETQMLQIEPNISPIINDPDHPIFHYKWNARHWLSQLEKLGSKRTDTKERDRKQHLLRVTVMLNTIGIVRKQKYMVDDEEVILKSEPMRTIVYDHKSRLELEKTIGLDQMEIPCESTTVMVVNEDCLVVYEKLLSEGRRPVLLNMANATNPGGGYRKGDAAQEENLFRRSNYYQSLDHEIADPGRSKLFICTAQAQLRPVDGYSRLYPMEEFGAIYTSGITVFRRTESEGYALMKRPLYDVCAIAMAAHRNPAMKDADNLTSNILMSTHRKINNIFAIAHAHKHDCLVLSAFGCGAFKNPAKQMALIFKSVILQYAGYFRTIYFAIIDDHNTGKRLNPDGNFLPYQQILDRLTFSPLTKFCVNVASGPYRVVSQSDAAKIKISDVSISSSVPCSNGAKCPHLHDDDRRCKYSHPSVCPTQMITGVCDTTTHDEVHMMTFIHIKMCRDGGKCENHDPRHLNEFNHPEYCHLGAGCQHVDEKHMLAYRHLPLCPLGLDCSKFKALDRGHCDGHRHCRSVCPNDNCCVKFLDRSHMKNMIHSFKQPCPFTPYNCKMYTTYVQNSKDGSIDESVREHCFTYSHVCLYGRQCTTRTEQHLTTSIHIPRKLCPDGDRCSKVTQEDHLESFTHPDIRDIRLLCKNPGYQCQNRDDHQHFRKYRHGQNHHHLSIAPSFGLNASINFVRNQSQTIKAVHDYIEQQSWQQAKPSVEILDWIRALQPVHRCSKDIFESILLLGHVMSRQYMHQLRDPSNVALAVRQHSRIRRIFLQNNSKRHKDLAHELIEKMVEEEFNKSTKTADKGAETSSEAYRQQKMEGIKKKLRSDLQDADIKAIIEWTSRIVQASMKLHSTPTGIGYGVDEQLGTNKHVFSILGPHLGHYYGDIIIVFKKEIMLHPDTNFTIQAATSFGPSCHAYKQRPWLKNPNDLQKSIENFHCSKLHCSVPGYEYAVAAELQALTGFKRKSMDVTVSDILARWKTVDSHQVIESHLPQLIPLDYVDRVYIPKNVFDSLSPEAKRSAKGAFQNALSITSHDLDLSLLAAGKVLPLDPTRQSFQDYVVEETCTTIRKKIEAQNFARGFVVTVPATEFDEQLLIPMTISQAFSLYCQDGQHSGRNIERTYLYWQAMKGDMILSITNQETQHDSDTPDLQCLLCYIAGKPSTISEDYHEEYSYLHNDVPNRHYFIRDNACFKAKSNRFHIGCNTEDFLTFRLEINHRTGLVILSHAGPNSIYNHSTIKCAFSKSELDLSKLNFVYLSAGADDVPIRNLTIVFEPIADLHPEVDSNFKMDTSPLLHQQVSYPYPAGEMDLILDRKPDAHQHSYAQSTPIKTSSFLSRFFDVFKCQTARVESSAISKLQREPRTLTRSTLPPCNDSIYCLHQFSADHQAKYSHLCRFSELCRNQANEPHLVHEHHNMRPCPKQESCSQLVDPVHRAKFRHKGYPDFLVPCKDQENCRKTETEHRIKYFHGELIPGFSRKSVPTTLGNETQNNSRKYPCRYGQDCRHMNRPEHLARYTHPTSF